MYLCRGSQSQAKNQLLVLRSLANIFAKETGIQLMDYQWKGVRFCSHSSRQCYLSLWQLLLYISYWYTLCLCFPRIGSVSSWLHVLYQQQRQPDCSGHPTVEVSKKSVAINPLMAIQASLCLQLLPPLQQVQSVRGFSWLYSVCCQGMFGVWLHMTWLTNIRI